MSIFRIFSLYRLIYNKIILFQCLVKRFTKRFFHTQTLEITNVVETLEILLITVFMLIFTKTPAIFMENIFNNIAVND